jgi:hypothetical protein
MPVKESAGFTIEARFDAKPAAKIGMLKGLAIGFCSAGNCRR